MKVNIISVEMKPKSFKGQVTNYYILTDDTGKQYSISEKSRYTWMNVQGKGTYDIEMGDYMGHPVVKKLRPLVTDGAQVKVAPKPVENPVQQTEKARLDFAAAKQNEIKLECYAGIAKDVLIASGKKDIKPKDVMQYAKDLMLMHNTIIELGDDLPGYGVDFLQSIKEAFPDAVVEKQAESKPVQQEFADDDPPF